MGWKIYKLSCGCVSLIL